MITWSVLVWAEAILHIAKNDLQLEITVTYYLIPRPLYVSQSAYTQLEVSKYQACHQTTSLGLLYFFHLWLLVVRMSGDDVLICGTNNSYPPNIENLYFVIMYPFISHLHQLIAQMKAFRNVLLSSLKDMILIYIFSFNVSCNSLLISSPWFLDEADGSSVSSMTENWHFIIKHFTFDTLVDKPGEYVPFATDRKLHA